MLQMQLTPVLDSYSNVIEKIVKEKMRIPLSSYLISIINNRIVIVILRTVHCEKV